MVQEVKLGRAPAASPPRSGPHSGALGGTTPTCSPGQAPSQGHRQSTSLSPGHFLVNLMFLAPISAGETTQGRSWLVQARFIRRTSGSRDRNKHSRARFP